MAVNYTVDGVQLMRNAPHYMSEIGSHAPVSSFKRGYRRIMGENDVWGQAGLDHQESGVL